MTLMSSIKSWLEKGFPQNFIIRKPLFGTMILLIISFTFILLYKPFNFHPSRSFSLAFTMVLYSLAMALPVLMVASILKKIRFFSNANEWNVLKEIIASLSVLCTMGLAIYFAGFIIEVRASRWNWPTFFSSFVYAVLLGIVPVGFFFVLNFRYLLEKEIEKSFRKRNLSSDDHKDLKIQINSTLKKESLVINPYHILYAESDGNYVVFHILDNGKVIRKTIRNSISSIEEQLSPYPFLFRTHRAFIVNLNLVASQKGNTLGYRLRINGVDSIIPVSRQNTQNFDARIRQIK